MIEQFFEGPAGCGKTYCLVGAAVEACTTRLVEARTKLLVLTFMNGARRRLTARFSEVRALRGRFVCLTIDSFAGMLVHRRRALLRTLPSVSYPEGMSDFSRTCAEAARLMERPDVAAWVAASYPVVVLDEAQDLDGTRLRLMRALAESSCMFAAADEFQDLGASESIREVMAWLRSSPGAQQLSVVHRTSHAGLLNVAAALRAGGEVCENLQVPKRPDRTEWFGPGIRIAEVPAKNPGLPAWALSDQLSRSSASVVVLTPSLEAVGEVLAKVQTKSFKGGLGPFALSLELREEERAVLIVDRLPATATTTRGAIGALKALRDPESRDVMRRLERRLNIQGDGTLSRDDLVDLVAEVLRDAARMGKEAAPAGCRVMTIQRAKNREFGQVVVLWPAAIGGGTEKGRRLLYNAVTRARDRCSVLVFGTGRVQKPPFSWKPPAEETDQAEARAPRKRARRRSRPGN